MDQDASKLFRAKIKNISFSLNMNKGVAHMSLFFNQVRVKRNDPHYAKK